MHLFDAAGIEIVCASWSCARRAPLHSSMPHRLRTNSHPWGLPQLSGRDLMVAKAGNLQLRSAIRMIKSSISAGKRGYLENPVGSIQWPVLRRIFAAEILAGMVRIVDTDMCCFGTLWKKPTRLLLWGPGLQSITFPRCCGKGFFCSITGKRHFQPSSATSCAYGVVNGRFRTRDAQEYPPKFVARLLSQLFAASGH